MCIYRETIVNAKQKTTLSFQFFPLKTYMVLELLSFIRNE